jgi:putative ABC transport system permease protein
MPSDTLRELWLELRTQKVRTLLSLLGIAWGTLAMLLLLAFSFGFEELFARRARGLGDAIAIAWPQRTTIAHGGFPAGRPVVVRRDDVLALAGAVPGLEAISAEFATAERVRVGADLMRIPISGVDPPFAALRSLHAQAGGRFPGERDSAAGARVIFLGDALASRLFPRQDPVGRHVVLRGAPFLVVGVLQPKEQNSDYGGKDTDRAYVPATTWLSTFGDRPVADFVFRARDPNRQAECSAAVVRALAARKSFAPDDHAALSVWDTTEQSRMMFYIFLGFHSMLALGGGFTLLVGGIGAAHLMRLLVRRRLGEIGLKLAVGADPARIRAEWLAQALALVLTGAGAGTALAVAGIVAVRSSPFTAQVGMPFVPVPIAIATAAVLAGIAFAAGYLPARTAARVDPVEALRSA